MKPSTYETIGSSLALFAAVVFSMSYAAMLQENAGFLQFVIAIPISLLILRVAWYFNCKATRLMKEQKEMEKEAIRVGRPPTATQS